MTDGSPIVTSAPGKTILAGEHSVVYGHPALVASTNLRLECRAHRIAEETIVVDLDDGYRRDYSLEEVLAYAAGVRELWHSYVADPSPEHFGRLTSTEPSHLVRLAVAEAWAAIVEEDGDAERGLELSIRSSLPVGSGLGSSAAVSASVVAAALTAAGCAAGTERVEHLASRVEELQHGKPSGLDTAAVVRGGSLWRETAADGSFVFEIVEEGLPALDRMRVVDSGRPGETTGEVVSWVRQRRRENPEGVGALLLRLAEGARALLAAVRTSEFVEVAAALDELHEGLRELGVVPGAVVDVVDRIRAAGGAAKISGAGALSGRSAGCLLVFCPDPDEQALVDVLDGMPVLTSRLGGEGLRVREEAPAPV